ncbi:hypothetical protein [Qipengyuania sediminis]|uniref:hypothetical protein n=1 Tax=Qipengyuania sediminis TaxID=1532023 RepID=UPI00105A47F7|nr:hypothetical protein [Qipengyuania sediminis]
MPTIIAEGTALPSGLPGPVLASAADRDASFEKPVSRPLAGILRAAPTPSARLWSGDAWGFVRAGSGGIGSGRASGPAYGGSQAGAVLRRALAPESPHRPAVYVRAVRALSVASESDLAAGLAFRPVAVLPITAHGEVRARRRGARIDIGPAGFLTAGIDEARLPAGFRARGYAQAGYVAGNDATLFADGSAVAERVLWQRDQAALMFGAGAWGGAERSASRLDAGPTASARLTLGHSTIRLSADYRFRIAGEARPAGGAALTVAAGF